MSNAIQQSPPDNTDHIAVNKYMLSLGFKWNDYDSGWSKDNYYLSQNEAVKMYTAIARTPNPIDQEKNCKHNYVAEIYTTQKRINKYIGGGISTSKYDIATIQHENVFIFCTKCGNIIEPTTKKGDEK